MGSLGEDRVRVEMLEVGPCKNGYEMGFLIGQRFSELIKSRVAGDPILQNQLRPYAQSPQSDSILKQLFDNNQRKYPTYWDELLGTAAGSGMPLLDILLINFRKEIVVFIAKEEAKNGKHMDTPDDDCCDVLVVSNSMAVATHTEDVDFNIVGHTYLIKAILPNGLFFVAYTYAGELPTCAFGFNNHGMAFTQNSVRPVLDDIAVEGIGRHFISRDLLEATSMDDAINRIKSSEIAWGHSYNLMEISTRKIFNVESASRNRISIHEVGETPFFHANMYIHLPINQQHDEKSVRAQKRASVMPKNSKEEFLSILGDTDDEKYPVYKEGPILYTICTAAIDLDDQTLSIIEGNPKKGHVSHVFSISPQKLP